MKSLVIGASGFVGKYLVEALLAQNHTVYATKLKNEEIVSEATVLDLDICDFSHVCEIVKNVQPDAIYHLAAQSSVKLSWEMPQLTAKINIIGTLNVLEAVRLYCSNATIIIIGSSEEYGNIDYKQNVSEAICPNPSNVYAVTKYSQENFAKIYTEAYDLHIRMTRSFNHIGPFQLPQFVVADFCNQVAEIEKGIREPTIFVGNLEAYRDFSDVRDVVRAYMVIAKFGRDGEVYNVGSGHAVQILEILQKILALSPCKITVSIDKKKYRPIDIIKIQADNSKLKSLGWIPEISIDQSIEDTLNYFRKIVR